MKAKSAQTRITGRNCFRKVSEWRRSLFIIMVVSSELFVRCAPVAYELQSARMTGKNQVELTPSFTKVHVRERIVEGTKPVTFPVVTKAYGVQASYGLTENLDLRLRVLTFYSPQATKTIFSTGLKMNLMRDRLAVSFPLWFVDYRPAQFQPTLLVSFPLVKNKVEFNPSGKVLLALAGSDPMAGFMMATSFGLAVSTDLYRWALRPEYSILYVPGKGSTGSVSIGLTFKLTRATRR